MRKFIGFLLFLTFFLSACGAGQTALPTLSGAGTPLGAGTPSSAGSPSPAAAATQSVATSVAATMAALSPTAPAPTPGQGKVILVARAENPQAQAVSAALKDLAAASKWATETRPALTKEEVQPNWKVVVFLEPPTNLAELQTAAPQSQFVALGGSDLEAKGSLSVIRQREEFRTFLGGFITTLIASDWRSLGLLPNAPANLQDAFLNGGRYWCGRCIPVHGPVVLFPVVSALAPGAAVGDWQGAVNGQQKNVIESVYLSPGAYSPELVKALFTQKLVMVGPAYPGNEFSRLWAATLGFDPVPALQKLWPGVSAGKGGQSADAGLAWSNLNEDLFSVGKQRLAQDTLAGLLDGTISPFSVPAQ